MDMEKMLPFLLMSGNTKNVLPFLMMNDDIDVNKLLPFLMMGDDNPEINKIMTLMMLFGSKKTNEEKNKTK